MAKSKVKTQDASHCPVCGEKFTEEEIQDYRDFGASVGGLPDGEEMPPFCKGCAEDGYTDMP